MKVKELLEKKRDLENKIAEVNRVITSANGGFQNSLNMRSDCAVDVYVCSATLRFTASRDVMLSAATAMLEMYQRELEPVNKKLEAIELMLSAN